MIREILKQSKQALRESFCVHHYKEFNSFPAGISKKIVVYLKCTKCGKMKKKVI